MSRVSRTPASWDPQDDALLRHLKENQKLGWKEIAAHFTNRTPNACQFRWRRLKLGSLKTTPIERPQTPPDATPPDSVQPTGVELPKYPNWAVSALPSHTGGNAPINVLAEQDLLNLVLLLALLDLRTSFGMGESFLFANGLPAAGPWTAQEDELLMLKRRRELSLAELSILLPLRTEDEILERIRLLERQRARLVSTLGLDGLSRTVSGLSQVSLASNTSSFDGGDVVSGGVGIASRR